MEPMRRQLKGERGENDQSTGREIDDGRDDEPQPEVDPGEREKGPVEGSAAGGEGELGQGGKG